MKLSKFDGTTVQVLTSLRRREEKRASAETAAIPNKQASKKINKQTNIQTNELTS
jgi:hypothetical protein